MQAETGLSFFPSLLLHQEDAPSLVSRLLNQLMKSDKYGERRGAAFGLAGVVKGFGIACLKKYGIVKALHEGLADRLVFWHVLIALKAEVESWFSTHETSCPFPSMR